LPLPEAIPLQAAPTPRSNATSKPDRQLVEASRTANPLYRAAADRTEARMSEPVDHSPIEAIVNHLQVLVGSLGLAQAQLKHASSDVGQACRAAERAIALLRQQARLERERQLAVKRLTNGRP
jgi:hypothetical protein